MILITYISFESLIILSMDINQSHSVLLGVRMTALYGLYFDLHSLNEFKGKNQTWGNFFYL